ncbi:MAG: response regulator [Halanaerobiales bacterium]
MIRVLIVDDEKIVRKGIISLMPWEKYNMKVVGEAANGKKALDFITNNSVDLLITDITMPLMTGIELIKIIKENYHQIAVVLLTCHQSFEYAKEAINAGVIDYIVKTQLEEENGEKILSVIKKRIEEKNNLSRIKTSNIEFNNKYNYSESIINSMKKAVNYIEENIGSNITQLKVAKEVNISRAYFSQCFKDLLGKSFGKYVREEKIKRAKEYLLNTSKPVYWIAQQVGFSDEKYFSRVFKKYTGLLPTEYRKSRFN